jgi:hypothetical protein
MVLAAATLVLVSPRALRMPAIWGGIAISLTVRIVDDWPLADNHIYLLTYWSLAVALSLCSGDAVRTLAFNSRCLVGLAFAFAVVWKLISPDFVDGRFFRVTLQTDPRFSEVVMLAGGLSADQLQANRAALAPLPEGAVLLTPPALIEPPGVRLLAAASTWGSVGLEALVGACMLLPAGRITVRMRHATLLAFCVVTYAFAPVAGFGWLLLVMGAAQTAADQTWLRRAYVTGFLLVLVYSEVPLAGLLLDIVR